jgi:hypothetical protein
VAFDFTTFHNATNATFTACPLPGRKPDYISDSGSCYWDTGDGVIRAADHWGRARSCFWTLGGKTFGDQQGTWGHHFAAGFAPYSSFRHADTLVVWGRFGFKQTYGIRAGDVLRVWVSGQSSRGVDLLTVKSSTSRQLTTTCGRRFRANSRFAIEVLHPANVPADFTAAVAA